MNDDDLPLRPIVSNREIATYQTAKYLANPISPIGTIELPSAIQRTFVKQNRKEKVPLGYKMVSFDIEYTLWQNKGAGLKKYGFGG